MNDYFEKFSDINNIILKAEELKKKKFNPGFDGMTAEKAYMWFGINAGRISKELFAGKYEPMPVIGFYTAKKGGGYRRFVRLTASDTIIQNVIIDSLREKYESLSSVYSHAYISGRGTVTALRQFCEYAEKYPYAAKIDPVSCFDNIDRKILKKRVDEFFEDEKLTDLIMKFVNVPVFSEGVFENPDKGIFQGAALSNMLCNIYFHTLDMFLEKNGFAFVRYADDIIIFGKSLNEVNAHCKKVMKFYKDELNLCINEKKSKTDNACNLTFLGHRFEKDKGVVVALENGIKSISAYANWYETVPFNFNNTVDILSDGILRQKDYSLIFENESDIYDIPVKNIDTINIYSSVAFEGGFLNKVYDNNIIVNVFNSSNKFIGRFIPNTPLKSPKITNEQIQEYFDTVKRLELAKKFVLASIHNTRLNIRYYNKQDSNELFQKAINKINNTEYKIKNCTSYDELLMFEAQVREAYYSCFDSFIKNEDFVFEKRTRRPPMDEVNALISFGNTVLYNLLATYIYKSPLDIRIGFLHATNNRKESLNLDLAEIFKPLLVDRVVFSLINRKCINKAHFRTQENGGVYLNEDGKRIFMRAFYEKLNTVITVKDLKHSYRTVIKKEVDSLVSYFRDNKKYTGFRQVR